MQEHASLWWVTHISIICRVLLQAKPAEQVEDCHPFTHKSSCSLLQQAQALPTSSKHHAANMCSLLHKVFAVPNINMPM
jgi:hypothetical protein